MKLFSRKDILLVLILLLASAIIFLFANNGEGYFYEITLPSGDVVRESIYKNKTTELDCGVKIKCDGKSVFFESSDCPDKTCVKAGKLSQNGEWTACLPNKVFLRVIGEEASK
jgi:hypothetical protein